MRRLVILCIFSLFGGLLNSSCSNEPEYQQVSYGGSIYYLDRYGHYYRYHGNVYRPCPKPPGKPDRPPRPVQPIEKSPIIYPVQPMTLPAGGDRTRPLPRSQPGVSPAIRPRRGP